MPIFKLDKYPYVCRMCLKPEQHRKMTALDTEDECFEEGTFDGFLTTITFQVEEEKRHLYPRSVCPQCKDLLRTFARFRTKVRDVHLFMNALVELRNFNSAPIKDLFQTKQDTVRMMLAELDLCYKADCKIEELMDEFPQFQIAKLPATMVQNCLEEVIEIKVEEPQFSEELEEPRKDSEDLTELTKRNVEEIMASKDAAKRDVHKQETAIEQEEQNEASVAKKSTSKTRVSKVKRSSNPRKRKALNWDLLNDSEPEEEDASKLKEPLQCPKCPYKTINKTHFHSHQLTHLRRENRSFPCTEPDCEEKLPTRGALRAHMEATHVTFVCESCGFQCGSKSKLTEHTTRFHSIEQLKCEYCERIFKVKADLHNHVKNLHLLENLCKCETCGMEFRRKAALRYHRAIHSDEYNFPCQECDKKFKIYQQLYIHIRRAHKKESFECEHCLRMFHTKSRRLDHIERVHEIRMRFLCDICVASLNSQENLTAHKARHDNPKKLECGRCLIAFPAQEQLSKHMCITYREDYVCCGRDLYHHVQYNRHMLTKHGVKINARVKPDVNVLLGQIRAKRKQIWSCSKCKVLLPTRSQKKLHEEECLAEEIKS